MSKNEPVIVADGMTNEELSAWLSEKVDAAAELHKEIQGKRVIEEQLQAANRRISELTEKACIQTCSDISEVEATDLISNQTKLAPYNISKGATKNYSPDILTISSELLEIIRSELTARGLEPAPGHIRWVFSVIEKALLADDLFD